MASPMICRVCGLGAFKGGQAKAGITAKSLHCFCHTTVKIGWICDFEIELRTMEPELLWAARCKGVMRSRFSAWMLAWECCPPFLDQRKSPQWASRAWAFTRAWEMPSKPCRAAQWRGVCAKPSCTSKNFDKGNRHDENCQSFGFKVQELLQLQMSEHLFEFAAVGVAPSFSKASRFAFGQIQKSIVGVLGCEQSAACKQYIWALSSARVPIWIWCWRLMSRLCKKEVQINRHVGRSVTPERHGPYLAAMFDKKCHGNPAATYIASAENHVHRQSSDLT